MMNAEVAVDSGVPSKASRTCIALGHLGLLSGRGVFAGRRVWTLAAFLALAPLVGLTLSLVPRDVEGPEPLIFEWLMFHVQTFLAPILLALVYGTAVSSGELEDGTIGFLVLGALRRWQVAFAQILAVVLVLTAMLTAGVGLTYAACSVGVSEGPEVRLTRALAGHALVVGSALMVFVPFFAFCGYAVRRSAAVGMVAVFLWEFMATGLPVPFARYTVTNNVRVLWIHLICGGQRDPFMDYAHGWEIPTYGQAAAFIAVLAAAFLAGAMRALSRRNLQGPEPRA